MKKTLAVTVCAIFLSALTAYAEGNIIEFRAGFSPSPKFDVTPSKKAKPSFEIGAEYRYAVTNNTEIGGGIIPEPRKTEKVHRHRGQLPACGSAGYKAI